MAEKAPCLRARLDHIELNSPDPGALAEFYQLALDMQPHRLATIDGYATRRSVAS